MSEDLQARIAELDDLTLAVRDMIGASRELAGRVAADAGQNGNDMAAVGMLVQFGPMGAVELARRLGIRSASATALIDRLERAGHAERVRDAVDRRRVVVTATAEAATANLTAWWPFVRDIDEVCRSLPATERAAALDLVERLTAVIDRSGDRDHPTTADTVGAPR